MLEISKASQITNTYHPSPYQTVIPTAQAREPHESQAMPIHRSKTNIPVTLCHPVWSHWNLKAMQGQEGARTGQKDRHAMLRHPAGYGIRGTLSFSACFLISHDRNHSQFSRNGWCPGSALNQCPSMVSGAARLLDVSLLVWVREIFHHLWSLKIPSRLCQGRVNPPDLTR